jgi:hypothetical protein
MRNVCFAVLSVIVFSVMPALAQQELSNPLVPARGKPRIYVGPVGGYNRSLHSSGFQSVSDDVLCPDFTTGTANGYYFGLSGEYLLGKPENSKSSIVVRVVYNSMPANYGEAGDTLPSKDATTQESVNSVVRHIAELKYQTLDLELMYKLNLFNSNFGVIVGPTVGMVVGSSKEQRMELVEPLNAVFDRAVVEAQGKVVEYVNNDRGIVTFRGDIQDRAPIRIAVKAGVQYELPIGRILLVPSVNYNFGITEVSPADNLRINAIQAGFDLRFAL